MSDSKNVNVRLVGPAGCGKTSFASQYAAKYNLPIMVVNCANVREPRDWFGYRKLDQDKNLVWHESLFVRMLETPNAVIVLDETNRCPMHTLNTLYPLLDHRRASYLEEANRTLTVAEGVTFWAAMNEGNQFTGTTQLDEAFADRTGLVHECKFLSLEDETLVLHNRTGLDKANSLKLVEIADQVRKKALMDSGDSFSKPISTRMLEEAAAAFVIGGPNTMVYTLLNHFSSSGGTTSERHNLKTLLTGKFGQL
jgi:nitric oxide reductase NorQ protein